KKNNSKVTAVAFVIVAAIATFSTNTIIIIQSAYAVDFGFPLSEPGRTGQAPSVVTGDNVYVAWWNGTAGEPEVQTDVMFRASDDGGATFSDKINLSNTTDADSWRVEIAGEGDTVVVSWWETNQTSDIPVARISTDGGETFGPMLRLGMNGTLTNTEDGGEGETTEEEAVGGADVAE
ncbi:MAG TPA: hypothetical protein VFQ47_04610, partial [Nitrososphaera sp.]|nr:hypothetical protein [Nitrososphaera sp.]